MVSNGKPLRRRLGFEILSLLGAGLLARTVLDQCDRRKIAKWSLISGAVAAPLFFFPRRTFKNRAVVITGGSRGLGLALARRLLKQGAVVTLLARDADELDRAKALLHEQVPDTERKVFCVPCDITDPAHLENAFAEARARFGRIDALINDAGSIAIGPLETMEMSDFDAQIDLHLRAVINAVRFIRPYLHQSRGGHIINISSVGGLVPVPHMAAYNASKFGVGGFSESIAAELRAENIVVTTVYPGLMRTGSPIQAVFKGNAAAEYSWFSASDNIPGLSVSVDCAAARILKAAADGQSRYVLTMPAKLGNLVHTLLPELFAFTMEQAAKLLPQGYSKVRRTGAESRAELAGHGIELPTEAISHRAENRNNQEEKRDAEFNLGVKSPNPTPSY